MKVNTSLELSITVYPDLNDETIMYYKELHQFSGKSWFSLGFKPKAKDLKTFIDDLSQFEYLRENENYEISIVLDGRKVRIGCGDDEFDPLNKNDEANEKNIKIFESLKVKEKKVV